ncbi:hypothetical protein GQ53DRAFT_755343 [Thozetella sp. PMI_491]|nr:hypothetical protein GQ53DRAFT_755343 [Thozetella sp. PMI_491]
MMFFLFFFSFCRSAKLGRAGGEENGAEVREIDVRGGLEQGGEALGSTGFATFRTFGSGGQGGLTGIPWNGHSKGSASRKG